MAGRVSGDLDVLANWQRALETIPKAIDQVSAPVAETFLGFVQEGFAQQKDPYGNPWAPKKKPDGRSILVGRTTRLRRGWHVVKHKRGFTIAPTVDYAAAHQAPKPRQKWGGKSLQRRMMVPTASRGLPRKWTQAAKDVSLAILLSHMRKSKGAGMGLVTAKIAGLKRRFNPMALVRKAYRAIEGGGGG